MRYLISSLLIACSIMSHAQTKDYSNDVKSTDDIIRALYEVISGAAGEARDWDRFNNLFTADARLIPTFKDKDGKIGHRMLAPADYVTMFSKNMSAKGFYENEVSHKTEEFGNIVHVFSTYESRETKDGKVFMRGINSIQLLKSNDRYYVVNIFWSSETEQTPLPQKYLK